MSLVRSANGVASAPSGTGPTTKPVGNRQYTLSIALCSSSGISSSTSSLRVRPATNACTTEGGLALITLNPAMIAPGRTSVGSPPTLLQLHPPATLSRLDIYCESPTEYQPELGSSVSDGLSPSM